jgi:molybdopterin converting factor subunit 1
VKLTILYFAAVRDLVGKAEESVDAPARTVRELREWLEGARPELRERLGAVRFARNEEFAKDDEALGEGDVIALIPPVSGG